ncbi:MAG: P-loop NTPase, partial [Candidatus Methanoperedens sp.]
MLFEHLIYSTSIAIIAGMIHLKKTGRDYSWIIIASALAPDLDMFAGYILNNFDTFTLINGNPLKHGDFHNIAVLFIFAALVGSILKTTGMKFKDSFIFAGIGFGAHLLEDALVYNPAYAFLWPLSMHSFGIGIVNYEPDWYGVANTGVLLAGIIVMVLCATARTMYEGKPGLQRTIRALALAGVLLAVTIPVFWIYQFDENFKDAPAQIPAYSNLVANPGFENGSTRPDNWKFATSNGNTPVWDTISHSGTRSIKISIPGTTQSNSGYPLSDKIIVEPLQNYTLSAWVKSEGVKGGPTVRVVQYDSNWKSLRQINLEFDRGTKDWTKKQMEFQTLPDTAHVQVYANIWNGYGTFWVDDVELYEGRTEQDIISNNVSEQDVENIIETGSLNKYGIFILIFMAVISLLLLRKYTRGEIFYKNQNKEINNAASEEKTEEEYKSGSKGSGKERRYHIIAIASGKGGVGKTTIAANLGIMLSKLHKKVTIIDMDLAMPNLEIISGLKSTPVGMIDVLEGRMGLDSVTYAGPEGIKIIPPGVMLEGYSKEDTKQKIINLLENLPSDNDYIILDMPPGREAIDVLSGNDIGVL